MHFSVTKYSSLAADELTSKVALKNSASLTLASKYRFAIDSFVCSEMTKTKRSCEISECAHVVTNVLASGCYLSFKEKYVLLICVNSAFTNRILFTGASRICIPHC